MDILHLDHSFRHRLFAQITTGSGAYVDSNWVSMINPFPFNAWGFHIYFDSMDLDRGNYYIDIGINDGTGVKEILSDFLVHSGYSTYTKNIGIYTLIPLPIPKGVEVLARAKSSVGGKYIFVAIYPIADSWNSLTSYRAHKNYTVTVNADDYSPWVEVTPSVPFHVKHIAISISGDSTSFTSDAIFWWKLGIGQAGAEKVILPYEPIYNLGLEAIVESILDTPFPKFYSIPCPIPKGERLTITHDASNTGYTTLTYQVNLFG